MSYLDCSPRDVGWQRASGTLEVFAWQLAHDTGVRLSPSYIRTLLRTQGCRRGKPRPAPRIPVRDRRKRLPAIAHVGQAVDPTAEVFYVAEADLQLNPRIGSTYLRRGPQSLVLTPGQTAKRDVAGAPHSVHRPPDLCRRRAQAFDPVCGCGGGAAVALPA